MKKVYTLFFLLSLLGASLCAAPTAKTFFKSTNAPLWLSHHSRPFQTAPRNTTDSVQSACALVGFYWKSTDTKKLGNYFGFYDDATATTYPFLRVTADASVPASLIPQDIVHTASLANAPQNTTSNPLKETITFNPTIEYYGFTVTNSVRIGEWITIHTSMPWIKLTHRLGMKHTDSVGMMVEGNAKGVMDFFTGKLGQESATSANQQDTLQYGKLVEKQENSGTADIHLLCLFSPDIHEGVRAHIGFNATLPTTSRSNGVNLFEPLLGNGGHPMFGVNGDMSVEVLKIHGITAGCGGHFSMQAGLSAHEVRSPSFLIAYDGGVDAQFGRYALAGKQNARRLFPLMNMLTQMVHVKPGTSVVGDIHAWANYKTLSALVEYRYTHTSAEKITPLSEWPANTYAVSRLAYSQVTRDNSNVITAYNTFNMAQDSTLVNNAPLNEDALLYESAATPTQATHTIGLTLTAVPLAAYPNSKIMAYGHYSFTGTHHFGVGGYGITCALTHTF